MKRALRIFAVALAAGALSRAPLAAAQRFLIVQPGYPGSTAEAAAFVKDLAAAIAGKGGPSDLAGEYHNDAVEALKAIERDKPAFAIVSLGFYLARRGDLKLDALLESRPRERFYLAAKKGEAPKGPRDLAGKAVAGTPFQEPEFVARVLFGPGSGDGAADTGQWKAEPTRGITKGVRDAARGKVAAVLLTEREKRSMAELTAGRDLEVFHQSEELPAALVVVVGASGEAAKAAAKAIEGLKETAEGRAALATMGIDGFSPVEREALARLEARFEKGE